MKAGDLVRVTIKDISCHNRPHKIVYKLGLLIEYHTWEKIATVLIDGERKRFRAENVTRAGRRDQEFIGGTL